ncbi:GtrA family protein [Pseudomonas sp. dw_358]|uniref:GtrA family protein n=1 Tax=Pseudomonas sp. dw_358 TaxID=2720083 RepID=UPI001BD65D9F|nr:GtrA family protein [Pseudomonas sp. dw_358]
MFKLFAKYTTVGVLNTGLHWLVFSMLHFAGGVDQARSNLAAFCVAATFSFYVNARYTFKASATGLRYVLFIGFMGLCSWLVGYVGDEMQLHALVTLVAFSAISLIVGFGYSSFVVFRTRRT